ncbi:hypothetical protein ACOSP7_009628 [Xanthoceras sorbifolium]
MALAKLFKVTMVVVFVAMMFLMSSEFASAAFDSFPNFKLGRRVLQDYPKSYVAVPGGSGGYTPHYP